MKHVIGFLLLTLGLAAHAEPVCDPALRSLAELAGTRIQLSQPLPIIVRPDFSGFTGDLFRAPGFSCHIELPTYYDEPTYPQSLLVSGNVGFAYNQAIFADNAVTFYVGVEGARMIQILVCKGEGIDFKTFKVKELMDARVESETQFILCENP